MRATAQAVIAAPIETVTVPAEYAAFEPLASQKRRYRLDLA